MINQVIEESTVVRETAQLMEHGHLMGVLLIVFHIAQECV